MTPKKEKKLLKLVNLFYLIFKLVYKQIYGNKGLELYKKLSKPAKKIEKKNMKVKISDFVEVSRN